MTHHIKISTACLLAVGAFAFVSADAGAEIVLPGDDGWTDDAPPELSGDPGDRARTGDPPIAHTDQRPIPGDDPSTDTAIPELGVFEFEPLGIVSPVDETPPASGPIAPPVGTVVFLPASDIASGAPAAIAEARSLVEEFQRPAPVKIPSAPRDVSRAPAPVGVGASPVPSPGALTLLGLAAAAGCRRRRRV